MSFIWELYLEKICPNCGSGFSSANHKAKHCCRACALSDREISEKTKLKQSLITKQQWNENREKMIEGLSKRDMSQSKVRCTELWKSQAFRDKIQRARKAAGYPDPNRPEQVVKRKLRSACKNILHRCLRNYGLVKTDHTYKLLGYSSIELRGHIEKCFLEGMSWENYGEWEIDHIIPITKFPNNTPLNIVNALNNLQPLWKVENRKKGNRLCQPSNSVQ